jgi:hypothetical protein
VNQFSSKINHPVIGNRHKLADTPLGGIMRRMFWLLLMTLALPVAALGSSVDFTNSGGTLSGGNAGLSLSGSTLIAVTGLNGMGLVTGNLGSVSLSTGSLSSGSLTMGGTFAAGGSFVITGNGTNGIPNLVIFNGSFSGPVTWALVNLSNGTHEYTLSGALTGTWYTGATANGATIQLTVPVGTGFFNGSATISSGDNNISVTVSPEPGSLTLVGTGLISLVGMLRSKLKR